MRITAPSCGKAQRFPSRDTLPGRDATGPRPSGSGTHTSKSRLAAWSIFACVVCILLSTAVFAAPAKKAPEAETPYYTRLSKLASYLSAGDAVGALEAFDKNMKSYGAIAENIQALAVQTDALCKIEIVEDKEADNETSDVHHLDLDWYMMLKSRTDTSLVDRRRTRVAVTMQRLREKSGRDYKDVWRITALSPDTILAPLTIK